MALVKLVKDAKTRRDKNNLVSALFDESEIMKTKVITAIVLSIFFGFLFFIATVDDNETEAEFIERQSEKDNSLSINEHQIEEARPAPRDEADLELSSDNDELESLEDEADGHSDA